MDVVDSPAEARWPSRLKVHELRHKASRRLLRAGSQFNVPRLLAQSSILITADTVRGVVPTRAASVGIGPDWASIPTAHGVRSNCQDGGCLASRPSNRARILRLRACGRVDRGRPCSVAGQNWGQNWGHHTKTAARDLNGRSEFELDLGVSPLGLEPRTG